MEQNPFAQFHQDTSDQEAQANPFAQFHQPAVERKRRTLASMANDTVIEVANAAAGGVSAAANFVRPGNAVSGWIDKNIVQAGEDSQSDIVKAEKQRFRQDVAQADGVAGELAAVGRYVVDNPLQSAAQAAGSFVAPGAAIKGARALGGAAGLGATGVTRAGLAGGAAAGAALAGGDAAGTAYDLSTKAGATDAQGLEAGRQASALPAVIGAVGGLVGAERLVAGAKGFAGNAASRALKTAAVEGAQEAIEEGVTQYEGQRAAMPYDPTLDPSKGVAAAAGMGATLGGATGAGVSLLSGGHQQAGPAVDGAVGAAAPSVPGEAAAAAPAAPAINPADGPLSKAAAMAGDLGLAPLATAPAPQDPRQALHGVVDRLPPEQQREARMTAADLDREDLPAGVRAMRDAELRDLVAAAPPTDQEALAAMEPGRVLRGFDARPPELPAVSSYAAMIESMVQPESRDAYRKVLADAQDPALSEGARAEAADALHAAFSPDAFRRVREWTAQPDARLEIQPSIEPDYGNSIDFTEQRPSENPDVARIAELAAADGRTPGAPLRLNEAHALRRNAAEAGIPVSVVPHPSGRGFDVQPTLRLAPEQRNQVPAEADAGLLPYDRSPSGRMVAGPDGVRQEARSEAVAIRNAGAAERAAVEAGRQRRTELGMSNVTPVVPVRHGDRSDALGSASLQGAGPGSGGDSVSRPPLAFDNAPTGRMVAGADGVRAETRAEVVNRANERAASPAPTIASESGAPFPTRAAALAERARQGLVASHRVVPAGGDASLGFVLQDRTSEAVPTQSTQALAAITSEAERPSNWRTNAMQANRVARSFDIDTKGKRLAQVVAEIDAADAARSSTAPTTETAKASTTTFAPESVAASADAAIAAEASRSGNATRNGSETGRPAPRAFKAQTPQPESAPALAQKAQVAIESRAEGAATSSVQQKDRPLPPAPAPERKPNPAPAQDSQAQAAIESGASAKPMSIGTAPGSTDPVTVRGGVVFVGKYEAVDYDTGEPVTVPQGSTRADVAKALKDAGALGGRLKVFGLGDQSDLVLYSTAKGAPPARGLSLEQAQKAVQEALAGLTNPPPIQVVLRATDLGEGEASYVKGVRKPDGQLAVVASTHSSSLDVVETVFHELFHQGVRNIVADPVYVQTMLDLAKRDSRVQQYANRWKADSPDAPMQRQALQNAGYKGSSLTAHFEALSIEEGLAVMAEELKAQKRAGHQLGLRVRTLATWLAQVAERMGMGRLAARVRQMTYTDAERFVLRAIDAASAVTLPVGPQDVNRYRVGGDTPMAQRVGAALRGATVTNLKQQAGFKVTDYRGLGLQFLGRRQLVDVYSDMLPELRSYSRLMARMDADKNEAGAGADQLANDWAKLPDERALAELMHDATLAQIDPAKEFVEGDNKTDWARLHSKYQALTPAAKDVYTRARDTHRQHMRDVRAAIKERIERSEVSSERKAALLKRMDDEFFGHIKGVYFPLARFGQYVVVVRNADGEVANVSRAETMAEATATRSQLVNAFPPAKGFTVGKVLKSKDFVAERDTVGRGFMEQLYGVLDKQGMDSKQRAELEDAVGQLYLSSLPDLSWAKHGIHRKGTPGFSQDARRAFAQNVFHGASYLAKLRFGDQLQDELSAMQRRVDEQAGQEGFDQPKAQDVVSEMVKRHDAAMNPKSNAISTALTSVGFMFHLGLSPASAMVNLTQTALVAYPIMGARWGFKKASAALLKASGEAARGKNDIRGTLNDDEKAAFDEAVRSGTIDVTMAHDLAGIAQGEDRNVSHKLRPVMRWASFMFHHAEKFNRQVTFVAAYRLAREAGAGNLQAYEQAVQATYDGHFDYSANNRARVMQGNVARVVLLFKQYGQNMVYTFARNAQQAIKAADPKDRVEARKALGGLLASHAMAAGVLGLPMVTTLLAAASMLGSDDDEPWDAEVALRNLMADAFGQKAGEVLAHGVSRLTPWDISGRVGLDKLILPDVQEGLEGQRLGESAMTAALGPVAAIGVNALKGLQLMSEGRYQMGLEAMAPSVLRGPLKAWRYEKEGVRDKSGIVVQDQVDAAAIAGQALGLSPSSVRNSYEGKSAIVGHDRALQARRSALVEQFAMAAMAKDEEGKAEAREAIAGFNEKNPNRRILPMQLAQSVRMREKRIREAEEGVYLPSKRRTAIEVGRFAAPV